MKNHYFMKVDHVFGGHIYVISSFGAARNPIYRDDDDINFFTWNVKKYLEEICEIYAYSHQLNQFQYLVKIKERPEMERFFHSKKARQASSVKNVSHNIYDPLGEIPPESYLIFSQEVSNCLNSYAKKFNYKYKRKGGLFGDRYSKHMVESEEEMAEWIGKLNAMEELVFFEEAWQVEEEFKLENEGGESSSKVYYENNDDFLTHKLLSNFVTWIKGHLRGCFECLPPKSIKALDFSVKFNFYKKIKGVDPPW